MSGHLFTTITGDDWTRQLRAARSRPNVVRLMIAERIRDLVNPSRQPTPPSECPTGRVRRADASPFTASGSADREGGGTPRAEAGGGDTPFGNAATEDSRSGTLTALGRS